jgi:predicted membrane protein
MRDRTLKEQRKAYRKERRKEFMNRRKRSGSVLAGFIILCVGTIFLLKQFGVPFPAWLFTWPMIIVAFGLLAGAGNAFRDPGWVVITTVGTIFLLGKIWPEIPIQHLWPVLIMALGLIIIVAPKRHRIWHERRAMIRDEVEKEKMKELQKWQQAQDVPDPTVTPSINTFQTPPVTEQAADAKPETGKKSADNWLDTVTIFGNVKKLVYSKNFKGGDIVSIFGGSEINLTQADFTGSISIEMVQIFGGAKLIVPPHWQIRSEMVAIFGGIEDKRPPQMNYDEDKVVVLRGTTFFGGIEIKSY